MILTLLSVLFYRWSVAFKQTNTEDIGDPPPLDIINNYFSIGVVSLSLMHSHSKCVGVA